MATNKKQLRRQMLKIRAELDAGFVSRASICICQRISRHRLFRYATRLGAYVAKGNEADLSFLTNNELLGPKHYYYPKLLRFSHNEMRFLPADKLTPMSLNAYGIGEPAVALTHSFPVARLNLLFLPLVAFDAQGGRLGMGGGYYDRMLNRLKRRPPLVGIGYACQEVKQVPQEELDIKLDYVVTELGWTDCRRRRIG